LCVLLFLLPAETPFALLPVIITKLYDDIANYRLSILSTDMCQPKQVTLPLADVVPTLILRESMTSLTVVPWTCIKLAGIVTYLLSGLSLRLPVDIQLVVMFLHLSDILGCIAAIAVCCYTQGSMVCLSVCWSRS